MIFLTLCVLQIVGLDQFYTKPHHLGKLNEIHLDLLVTNLNLVLSMYPILSKKPIRVFVEANLSQDLAAFMEKNVRDYYKKNIKINDVSFVKQFDSKGNILPGILTRHKANLVSYFRRLLNDGYIFIARQISTVSIFIDKKYEDAMAHMTRNDLLDIVEDPTDYKRSQFPVDIGVVRCPTSTEMANVIKILVEQATLFRCYTNNTSVVYSGKRSTKSLTSVDDLLMALILATAWARLPNNTYMLS
jgi:hypothetical protein